MPTINVFINCPFDSDYEVLLRPIIFTLLYFHLNPCIAKEDTDCSKLRIDKIIALMRKATISIHDLSRMKSSTIDEYYRLNMPFELGIDFCLKLQNPDNPKKIIVFENEKYSLYKALSDYAGFDVLAHNNEPPRVIKILRDWLVNNGIVTKAKGANAIWYEYNDCWAYIFDKLVKRGFSKDETREIPYQEYKDLVTKWCKKEKLKTKID